MQGIYLPYFIWALVNVWEAKAEKREISRASAEAQMISANFLAAVSPASHPNSFKFCCCGDNLVPPPTVPIVILGNVSLNLTSFSCGSI